MNFLTPPQYHHELKKLNPNLSKADVETLIEARQTFLAENNLIEFGTPVLNEIVEQFSLSPYLNQGVSGGQSFGEQSLREQSCSKQSLDEQPLPNQSLDSQSLRAQSVGEQTLGEQLAEILEIFYKLREEIPVDVSDSEIVQTLRNRFDTSCAGEVDSLASVSSQELLADIDSLSASSDPYEAERDAEGIYSITDDEGRVYTWDPNEWHDDIFVPGWLGEQWNEDE